MGKNKQIRKRITGLYRVIEAHQPKIQDELRKNVSDAGFIRKREREIDFARKAVRKLEKRLEK